MDKALKRLHIASVILAIAMLTGCTSLVERQILNMEPVSGMASFDFITAPNNRKVCDEQNPNACLRFLDLGDIEVNVDGDVEIQSDFHWTLTLRSNVANEQDLNEYFSEETLFTFPELSNDAPVVIVAPGFGMESGLLLAPTGVWLRSLGFRPLIIAGPTESKPMAFGLPNLSLIRDHVLHNFSAAPVVLMGFSMGMLATTELEHLFIEQGIQPAGLVLVAPMSDFRNDANFMFQQQKEADWRLRWFVSDSRFDQALGNIITRSGEAERLGNLHQRLAAIESPALVVVGREDEVVAVNNSRSAVANWLGLDDITMLANAVESPVGVSVVTRTPNENIEQFEVLQVNQVHNSYLEYSLLNHPMLMAVVKPVRQDIERWLQQFVPLPTEEPEEALPEVM